MFPVTRMALVDQMADLTEKAKAGPGPSSPFRLRNEGLCSPSAWEELISSAHRNLPHTAGHSDLELVIGLAMLGGGIAALFAFRRKSLA